MRDEPEFAVLPTADNSARKSIAQLKTRMNARFVHTNAAAIGARRYHAANGMISAAIA
jgi:hypothetical protein